MKKILAAALLALATLPAVPASAESLDISTLKCSDLADMKAEEVGMLLAWIDGYLAARRTTRDSISTGSTPMPMPLRRPARQNRIPAC